MHHPVTFTRLGDFTATQRLPLLSTIAVALGVVDTQVAVALRMALPAWARDRSNSS